MLGIRIICLAFFRRTGPLAWRNMLRWQRLYCGNCRTGPPAGARRRDRALSACSLQNLSFSIEEADPALGEALQKRAAGGRARGAVPGASAGGSKTASRLHPNDLKRVIRALELYRKTGRTMAEQNRQSRAAPSLYQAGEDPGLPIRIVRCFIVGLTAGWTRCLPVGCWKRRGCCSLSDCGLTAVQAIGYKELVPLFFRRGFPGRG